MGGDIVINQTINGKFYRCSECSKIHVDFKNLSFQFDHAEFRNFKNYIIKLDTDYWATENERQNGERKVMIPINHQNLTLKFKPEELNELKDLLGTAIYGPRRFKLLKTRNFDFRISDN